MIHDYKKGKVIFIFFYILQINATNFLFTEFYSKLMLNIILKCPNFISKFVYVPSIISNGSQKKDYHFSYFPLQSH